MWGPGLHSDAALVATTDGESHGGGSPIGKGHNRVVMFRRGAVPSTCTQLLGARPTTIDEPSGTRRVWEVDLCEV
jgi:hypothetical protein